MTTSEFISNFHTVNGRLLAFAMKLTRHEDDAKDLVQETACKAYENKEKFKLGTNFGAWTSTILRNTFINNYRKNKKQKAVELPMDTFTFVLENHSTNNTAETVLAEKEIINVIKSIGPIYRMPFMLFYEGYQYMEIAEELNIPIGTVKSRLHFARKQLKMKLQQF